MGGESGPGALRHRRVRGDGVDLHCVEAGEGPPVVLLHGFPEFWYSWRRQMRSLAAAGFRALAPDQRGYHLSDKPRAVEAYRLDRLAADVAVLVEEEAGGGARLVGHDWGGVVAWHVAIHRPELVERLAILNAPHPAAYRRELRRSAQALRSWYVLFFQLPGLPEAAIRSFDYAALDRIFGTAVRPGAFTGEDLAAYKAALDRPGALTGALNWYRANFPLSLSSDPTGREGTPGTGAAPSASVEPPTFLLWGERDPWLDVRLLDGLERWVPRLRVRRWPDVGHWLQAEAPAEVSRELVAFLGDG